ncbi:glycine cleavage system transcriptional repressor [Geobacter sp. OR-1]|uniref:glycine cleavage system protein R n=1 Tax=Geobacter sp. OR-1 TaxID=1266765 RepID=UPI0005430533|nr:ACT domain-containing protein [Geobacter sp. OR-1]GAM08666.1 glycine cleavage system transcriptional repressor [Geobacter sp. OR-1]
MTHCRKENLVHFAVTIISKDRPGIVADVTEVLFRLGCNIEDSSCTMLGGDFAMILIVSHEKPFTKSKLVDEFKGLNERTGLVTYVRTLSEAEICPVKEEGELCLISVYGSDQPGIVYRVTRVLADLKVNIADLNTKLIGTVEEPVYVLMLEATLPAGVSIDDISSLLENLRKELKVEITVRSITPVSL